jgi:hypothetical protein
MPHVSPLAESITTNIAELKQDFADFRMWTKSEIAKLNDKITTVGTEVASQRVKIKSITEGGGTVITRRVDSMENEIQRRECLLIVTISGLPICRELNDIDAVIKMGNIVGARLDRNDIRRCWRAKVMDPTKVPLLYCNFVDHRPRNMFFHACLKHKNVTLDKIIVNSPITKIFVNEMLSASNFKVWQRARHFIKLKKLDKVYSVDGRVLIKFCGDKVGRPVFTVDDLNNVVDGGGGGEQ